MHVICTNDKKRPHIIPKDLWIVENEMYEVEQVLTDQSGERIFKLYAPQLPDIYYPCVGFSSKRFAIIHKQQIGES
jgi:hypothetical protein